jgi:hypothetical protein
MSDGFLAFVGVALVAIWWELVQIWWQVLRFREESKQGKP